VCQNERKAPDRLATWGKCLAASLVLKMLSSPDQGHDIFRMKSIRIKKVCRSAMTIENWHPDKCCFSVSESKIWEMSGNKNALNHSI
jgi:hypothetical protein